MSDPGAPREPAPRSWLPTQFGILAAVAAGVGLRLASFPESMSHFDEGQYALAQFWPAWLPGAVGNAFFSPPLWPSLQWLVARAVGPDGRIGPYLALLCSVATILRGSWLAWRWGGRGPATLAAWLLATDGMQVAFAQVGLTDALFTLLFLFAWPTAWQAIDYGGWRRCLVAGLWVGLAWSTKYSGWLPLAVALGALAGPLPWVRRRRWLLVAAAGGLFHAAWAGALELHLPGGYAALIAHQRGYASPPGQWLGNLMSASVQRDWLGSVTPMLFAAFLLTQCRRAAGLGFAACGVAVLANTPWRTVFELIGVPVGAIDYDRELALFGTSAPWLGLLPAAVLPFLADRRFRWGWTLAVMLAVPMLYRPYLRIWLPTETVLLLMAALACGRLDAGPPAAWWRRLAVGLPALAVGVVLSVPAGFLYLRLPVSGCFRPHDRSDYYAMRARFEYRVVGVLARPPVLYYMRSWPPAAQAARFGDQPLPMLHAGEAFFLDDMRNDCPIAAKSARDLADRNLIRLWHKDRYSVHPLVELDDGRMRTWDHRELRIYVSPN